MLTHFAAEQARIEAKQQHQETAGDIVNLLAKAWDKFLLLPERHVRDREEFMHAIHAAQNMVLAWMWVDDHDLDAPLFDPDDDTLSPSPPSDAKEETGEIVF